MRNKAAKVLTIVVLSIFLSTASFAADADEAAKKKFQEVIDMAKAAAAFLSEKGKDGFPEINDPKGKWVQGELYPFVYGLKGDQRGVIIAHPREGLVGKNFLRVRDKKGKIFAAEFLKIAESGNGEGWSEYWWPKLKDSKPEPKVSYIVNIPGKDMLVGVGIYGGHTKEEVLKILGN